MFPAIIKKGIAISGKESTATNILVTNILRGRSLFNQTANKEAMPIAKATGVLMNNNIKKDMNNISNIILFLAFYPDKIELILVVDSS